MKSTKNSWHAKLYLFSYDSKLPDNLCPYFWKVILGAILFVPRLIFRLPYYGMEKIGVSSYEPVKRDQTSLGFMGWVICDLLFLLMYITYHLIKAMFGAYSYNSDAANLGILIYSGMVCVVLYIKINSYRKRYSETKSEPGLIKSFIKAKYNKLCPRIEWTDKK